MIARLGSIVVALALVAGAMVLRGNLDDRQDLANRPLSVVCAAELGPVCDRLREEGYDVAVEDALVTARGLAALTQEGDGADDLWLTAQPAAELVNSERKRRSFDPVDWRIEPVGRTELAVVVWSDRAVALQKACPELTMRCIGDVAGRGSWAASGGPAAWGRVKVALADPDRTASGLVALGAGARSWFGRADVGSNDFDGDPGFGDWMAGLARAAPRDASLARMLALGRAALDLALVPAAVAAEVVPRGADVQVLPLAQSGPVEAVAVVLPESRGEPADVARALRWPAAGDNPERNLPADVLEALRLRWAQLAR